MDVDLDILFTQPSTLDLKTEKKSRTCPGLLPNGHVNGQFQTTQTGLIANTSSTAGFTAVLFPRLKTEKPATVTSLADGNAVKVTSTAGTDHVFVSPTEFTFQDADISFTRTANSIQIRGNRVVLSLGAAGQITARGETLKDDKAASKEFAIKR